MEKLTNAQLIALAKEKGIELNSKMLKAKMIEIIRNAEAKEFKVGELTVLLEQVTDCGCSYVPPKTIVKILRIAKGNKYPIQILFCNRSWAIWVGEEKLRKLNEQEHEYAAVRFNNATPYKYATVD